MTMWPRMSIVNGVSNLPSVTSGMPCPAVLCYEEKVLKQVLMSQLEDRGFGSTSRVPAAFHSSSTTHINSLIESFLGAAF